MSKYKESFGFEITEREREMERKAKTKQNIYAFFAELKEQERKAQEATAAKK